MDPDAKPSRLADATELESFVSGADVALVEFFTSGCPKCAAMEPVLGTVARSADVSVGLINPRTDPGLIEAYDVRSVPTLVVFVDGVERGRLAEGFQGAEAVIDLLAEHAPEAVPETG